MTNVSQGSNQNRIGSKFFSSLAVTNGTFIEFPGQNINGFFKNFYYKAPNLATDTVFTLEILDANNGNVPLFTLTNLADNQTWFSRVLTMDIEAINIACQNTTVKISWATAQTLVAGDFQLLLPIG